MNTQILSLPLALAGWQLGAAAILGLIVLALVIVIATFFMTWLRAMLSGAAVGFPTLIAMRLRGVPAYLIVNARITAVKAGIEISANDLEAHYLAEGNVIQTVQAIIAADKANISLNWQRACAIDLATKGTGKSVLEAVRTSINPKVIECPASGSGRTTIDGVAKDGIQVKARARVTVRSNLDIYVGSALEETIIARVGEGIVTTIGSALSRGLDVGTAFEILSIDIADVDVGENIGAKLQESQAEADKNVAQAKAEMRRAAAVALEQEMKAKVEEMRAKVVEAEAEVPLALADAFRSGNLGVMDYYKINNIKADTDMRDSISKGDEEK